MAVQGVLLPEFDRIGPVYRVNRQWMVGNKSVSIMGPGRGWNRCFDVAGDDHSDPGRAVTRYRKNSAGAGGRIEYRATGKSRNKGLNDKSIVVPGREPYGESDCHSA